MGGGSDPPRGSGGDMSVYFQKMAKGDWGGGGGRVYFMDHPGDLADVYHII